MRRRWLSALTPRSFLLPGLDVYQVGLDFMRWFVGLPGGRELSDRLCREVD